MRDTYTTGSTWDNSTLDVEECLRLCEKILAARSDYAEKVAAFLKWKWPCPLIIQMYGSMAGAFGLHPVQVVPKLELPQIEIIPPITMAQLIGLNGYRYFGSTCGYGAPICPICTTGVL